jgi:Ni,Fe-hydrogenase III large subunit
MPFTIPVGPYHPALEEPFKVSVRCVAETVEQVSVEVGFSFRAIELLAQRSEWVPDVTLIERVCGICSNVHAMTFCRAAERIAGIDVPKRALYIRTIIAELERVHSHLLWAGLAAEYMGFQTLFMEIFTLREQVMDLLETISGNRVNYGMNRIGGVNRDIADPKAAIATVQAMAKVIESDVVPAFMTSTTAKARMTGVGPLSKEDAIAWGVVGPVARASGLDIDVRNDHPHLAYQELGFKSVTQPEGDVRARVVVRALELLESCSILRQALTTMPAGPFLGPARPKIPAGMMGFSRVEAPRGEVFYMVRSSLTGKDIPARVKIRTPTFVNMPGVRYALAGNELADSPLIQASCDPCYSCTDR